MWVALMAAAMLATAPAPSNLLPAQLPSDRRQLVADLDLAQQLIDDPSSPSAALESAGRFEQLATAGLLAQPRRVQRMVLGALSAAAGASIRTDLAADTALRALSIPHRSLPPWKIVAPPPAATSLRYFRHAQSRFGVRWEYLAAIEFIETKFGRVVGLSSAGAEGPMQFLAATWATYGNGDVHNPRDAIFGAARYLVASGAPGDISAALYHYNPSGGYVAAVEDYAARMRADPRAYYGYYYWQVTYSSRGRPLILPVGYPRARPVSLGSLLGSWRG
jgi:hypothetical protein